MSHNIKQQKCAVGGQANEGGAVYAGAPAPVQPAADPVNPLDPLDPFVDAHEAPLFEFNHEAVSLEDMKKVEKTRPSQLIEAKVGSSMLNLLKTFDPNHKAWDLGKDKAIVAGRAGHLVSVPFIVLEALGDIAKAAILNPIQRAIKKRADNNADDDDMDGCVAGGEAGDDACLDVEDDGDDDVDQGWDEDDDCGDYVEEKPTAPKKKGIFAKIFGRRAKKNNSKK